MEIEVKLVLYIIIAVIVSRSIYHSYLSSDQQLDQVISNEQGKTIIKCLSCLFAVMTNNRERLPGDSVVIVPNLIPILAG